MVVGEELIIGIISETVSGIIDYWKNL